jgi:hypothetical protein
MSLFNYKNCSSEFYNHSGLVLNKYNVGRKKQKGTNITYNVYCFMIAVEVKGRDPKFTWEIVGIYRAPYEDM